MIQRSRRSVQRNPKTKSEYAALLTAEGYWITLTDGKKPVLPKWQARRLTANQIAQRLERQPHLNLAIVLGRHGIIDVECDGPDAEAALQKLFAQHGMKKIPATPTYRSSRGFHRLFQLPPRMPKKAVIKVDGIEFRLGAGGKGALSVIPPSVHPDGHQYKWVRGRSIVDVQPASLPKSLVDQLRRCTDANGSTTQQRDPREEKISRGQRSDYLTSLAGTMRRRGMKENAIRAALVATNQETCSPPLKAQEVEAIAKSVMRYEPVAQALHSLSSLSSQEWPVLDSAALYGLSGEIVGSVDAFTEADPVATLASVLTMFGNIVGSKPHYMVGHTCHSVRINTVLVGTTSKGRKGTSLSTPKYLFSKVDSNWNRKHVVAGLSSGEGVIQAVSNLVEPAAPKNRAQAGRLLVVEEEFASPLIMMKREGNILSVVLRQGWDSGNLSTLTRNNPLQVCGAHVSIIGHVTQDELAKHLADTHKANGFANRFLWLRVKRSKLLPDGAVPPVKEMNQFQRRLRSAVEFATKSGELHRDKSATELWHAEYARLSEGEPGMIGAILSRAEAQVLRLSMIYSLLDKSRIIRATHLEAALALWAYCEQSARGIFRESTGNSVSDHILQALAIGDKSLTDLSGALGRHVQADVLREALESLEARGKVRRYQQRTPGRSKEIWGLAKYAKQAK